MWHFVLKGNIHPVLTLYISFRLQRALMPTRVMESALMALRSLTRVTLAFTATLRAKTVINKAWPLLLLLFLIHGNSCSKILTHVKRIFCYLIFLWQFCFAIDMLKIIDCTDIGNVFNFNVYYQMILLNWAFSKSKSWF